MSKAKDLTGQVFSNLTVLYYAGKKGVNKSWMCQCSCGRKKEIRGDCLKSGHTKTCGYCSKNKFKETENYVIGYTKNGDEFIFDKEDYIEISKHTWCKDGKYISTTINYKKVLLHRFIMKPPDDMQVDHISRIKSDYRRRNLRIVTSQQNNMNSSKIKGCLSKYKGVTWCCKSKKWKATISYNRKSYYLKTYENEVDAAIAYNIAASKFFGEFASLNII